jgi:outer membrane protein insertion porin family
MDVLKRRFWIGLDIGRSVKARRATTVDTRMTGGRRCVWLAAVFLIVEALVFTRGAGADWPAHPARIAQIAIEVRTPVANGFDWQGLARALIGLNQGDLLTQATLEGAVKALSSFGKVGTDVLETRKGVDVAIRFAPYERIKSISVEGMYPLFEQDVRNVMTLAPGSIFTPDRLQSQVDLIARLYTQEGYVDPRISISWHQDETDNHILLDVHIEKGPYFRLAAISFEGNTVFQSDTLIRHMAVWRKANGFLGRGRFLERLLREDMQTLTELYRRKGYADVVIDDRVTRDLESRQAAVHVGITEGPLTSVVFSGNSFFSDRVLKQDLELFKTGNHGNAGLRRSVHNIRRRYLAAGFADVSVHWQDEKGAGSAPNRRVVRIQITEGLRHMVTQVILRGNRALSDDVLRAQMLTRPSSGLHKGVYVATVLEEDLSSLQALYLQKGFLDARITDQVSIDAQSKDVAVTISIDAGVATRVKRISFSGHSPVAEKKLRGVLQMQPGDAFRPYLVENEENRIAEQISPLGYPYVQVKGTANRSQDHAGADIDYHIDSGPRVTVGEIFFAGNFRTRPDIMTRELDFKKGDPFSLSKVLEAQRNLRNLDLFESVQVRTIGLKEKASTVPLFFETPEKRPDFFEIGGGYQTDKGVYGRTKVGDHNFRGADQDIWAGAEVGDTGYRLDAGITSPRLLGYRIRTDLGVFAEHREEFNQDFGTDTLGSTLTFSRKWRPYITTSLGLRFEQRDQFLRVPAASADVDPDTLDRRLFLVTTPAISYDDRNSFIRPTRGWFSTFSVDISNGLDGSLDNFIRYKFDVRTFYTPIHRLTLAAIARAGYLTTLSGSTELPEDQLFFLGGTTTVRGYDENLLRYDADGDPVGGRRTFSGSLEARYNLGGNFELAFFVDGGAIQDALVAAGSDDWRWSVGTGLRYITPIGPIGLLYGYKLDRRPGEASGQFHFSIGYTF